MADHKVPKQDLSTRVPPGKHKLRFVTASSLFDGHDASINIIRRILQSLGVEVIHLGHNRSVAEIVNAALQEDVQAIAVSSYQGGHVEFFQYMVERLKQLSDRPIQIFAGGGGVITGDEIELLQASGVTRIYTPQDGQQMGLQGMVQDMLSRCPNTPHQARSIDLSALKKGNRLALAHLISDIENARIKDESTGNIIEQSRKLDKVVPVLGITGTGGAGKSSLTDELIGRFRLGQRDRLKLAVIALDPTRRKTGGALLGDRIRMNAIEHPDIYFRSMATRDADGKLPDYISTVIAACQLSGFDLIIVETPGIGQGDAAIAALADCSLYVMTPEYGAQSQLEKIDMLDYADFVAINKFDKSGAEDALHDVGRQFQRNREAFSADISEMPVFGATASRFNDDGVTALYHAILDSLGELGMPVTEDILPRLLTKHSSAKNVIVPPARNRYLAEIASSIRQYKQHAAAQAELAREHQQLCASKDMLAENQQKISALDALIDDRYSRLDSHSRELLQNWPGLRQQYSADTQPVEKNGEAGKALFRESLSGLRVPKLALPDYGDHGELLRWLLLENVPGVFPYTAGVFTLKRVGEQPARMFAGEGDAEQTNQRFKKLSEHASAKRLSTAFDSVTLYGFDPDERPDIYGKVGNSGVSIATLDDMKILYDGFDLCDAKTSVSMTINGPAPVLLAMFMNCAIDQQLEKFRQQNERKPNAQESEEIRSWTLQNVRGTVQADILKEDQGQNTCIFCTDFALKMMGDIQQYFIHQQVRKFYSVSISGYHIAEAGANPISQLAFTLANGFTYVEAYLARGMAIDDFCPNLSFFFSNGMEPEYSVIGRVARRIWAIAMREKYAANDRSQKLKYHIQTSGRSLHAQEMNFNDIRTTLQALIALYDNCNSLHTNAYDEAITTPGEESVRRALAIQMIINNEWGLSINENPNQGAFIIEQLTELVEQAVLDEFDRLAQRGGVLGAMESGYQRAKIQHESMLYEHRKHDGSLPIVGVNCFINPDDRRQSPVHLARSSDAQKDQQITRLKRFKRRNKDRSAVYLERIKMAAINEQNIFDLLMEAVRYCSLGQITTALFEVGGQYRRNM